MGPFEVSGAGDGNRTRNNSLEGCGNTFLQRPQVGAAGLEPATSASQTQRASICATPRTYLFKYTAFGVFRQGYGDHERRWLVQLGRLGPRARILWGSSPFGPIR